MDLPAQMVRVQLQAHEEHVEDDAQLRHHSEERRNCRRKDVRVGLRRDLPQQRRPQQDAGNDLADHWRLVDVIEEPAEYSPGYHHHRQRDQEVPEDFGGGGWPPHRVRGPA